jgi:hypothetical protein
MIECRNCVGGARVAYDQTNCGVWKADNLVFALMEEVCIPRRKISKVRVEVESLFSAECNNCGASLNRTVLVRSAVTIAEEITVFHDEGQRAEARDMLRATIPGCPVVPTTVSWQPSLV